jgi:hypothetical protein
MVAEAFIMGAEGSVFFSPSCVYYARRTTIRTAQRQKFAANPLPGDRDDFPYEAADAPAADALGYALR